MGSSAAALGPSDPIIIVREHAPCSYSQPRPLQRRRGPRARRGGGRRGARQEPTGLAQLVGSGQPLLLDIAVFLCSSPVDFGSICCASAQFTELQVGPIAKAVWRQLYANRWPCFYECLSYQGAEEWQKLYRETLAGNCEFVLEIFDREKKLGFAMAAMPARVSYFLHYGWGCYVARYLSASEVPPEKIPLCEEHRLRFCPPSVRPQLQPGRTVRSSLAPEWDVPVDPEFEYPNKVLQGFDGLKVGNGVELQWKMQYGSPFGWWYGQLDRLHHVGNGLAEATITFRHFPATSRWYRLDIVFGDSQMRKCSFGGYTGGVRAVSEQEQRQVMRFFPGELVVF